MLYDKQLNEWNMNSMVLWYSNYVNEAHYMSQDDDINEQKAVRNCSKPFYVEFVILTFLEAIILSDDFNWCWSCIFITKPWDFKPISEFMKKKN